MWEVYRYSYETQTEVVLATVGSLVEANARAFAEWGKYNRDTEFVTARYVEIAS